MRNDIPGSGQSLPGDDARRLVWLAVALSSGAALSLGITRFAYGLLLPTMREDLGWSYTLAGAMNTANAFGYLLGALVTPRLMARRGPASVLVLGSVLATVFMALSGFFERADLLLLQRLLAGMASALVFIAGGLLAARLGSQKPSQSGLLIGLYYGGTGLGISLSAVLVPGVLSLAADRPHAWAWAWWVLALACVLATLVLLWPARVLPALSPPPSSPLQRQGAYRWTDFRFALAGYGLFGVGYIGYMTFVVALLREQGATGSQITVFYGLLGVAVLASSRIWARLLDRHRGGGALARLNALLGLAVVLPVLSLAGPVVLVSGLLFGAVFLSVVASTTALVRHNLPQSLWAAGIAAFTTVFAFGQIVGPTVVGWIADGPGGLA
ncbi:MAG: YbfB/YjiJ family MFS transporter, partial [Rhodoferax sp.]|nr:YbfB/YjiJ family MFS transporter [Rhodoferax sp.]